MCADSNGESGGKSAAAIEATTTKLMPGLAKGRKASRSWAVPNRLTYRIWEGGAWTGDTAAVWTTEAMREAVVSQRVWAAETREEIEAREEMSISWVVIVWPSDLRVVAALERAEAE